ncbi:MAG: hypothetical protein ABIT38_05030 [Gemmatimonadaceae bacterium]
MLNPQTDVQLELMALLALSIVGQSTFAVFEVETPAWRKILKWTIIVGITLGLRLVIGHAAALVLLALGIAGATFHVIWCRSKGIDPVHATPRKRYYALRG